MFKIIILLSLLGLFRKSDAQFILEGQCDNDIQLQNNFNLEEFLGTWYEVGRAPGISNNDCSVIEITQTNNQISFTNTAVASNFNQNLSGTATLQNGTAKFTLNLGIVNGIPQETDFWILETTSQYTLGYRCLNINPNERSVSIWQLGREPTVPNQLLPILMNNTLSSLLGIYIDDLQTVDQSTDACYALPVIQPEQPVVIPGQCNPNILVVQNFDVANFTGVWHEISSYYSENAIGVCARAEYTLGDGVVSVLNSQVVNQTLDTITGYAVPIGADGSGRLNVTLQISPNEFLSQELLVIATDYENYAITYSCENLSNDTRRVYSWIVSRNRVVSPATQAAIDAVVNSLVELNYAYYQDTNRTDNDCFYYPEPSAQPPVFRGPCDLTIPAVPNFDAGKYLGLWHDIESFPSEYQGGTCNNAFYTLNGGVVDVFNTQVINQTLDTINGVAIVASDDGSGKLLVTFPIVGTNLTIQTNYWILDTDYETYSLVYTCEYNENVDTRTVWSWKLSRTKNLTPDAIAKINNITSAIEVLDQRYYVAKDQSEEGCFYFPEPQPGVPVVFPGQCDETISVVNNFNFQQFSGTWYEIEAYPKDEQSGQCINHQYTQGTGNTLNLQSSTVLNQFLQISTSTLSFNSTDNSAKLLITLNNNGTSVEIPFWILTTDYTDYALAYSCVNRGNDFRAIYSWKLSKNKQLSPAANMAFSGIINNIEVLDDKYYETIDQSDAACFYLPELAPGEPVVLVGQCDQNISVVQNFDAVAYQGLWHLIESYPSTFQNGTCNDASYTIQNDGTVLVYNTQVVNETLDTITGSAAVASTDGSAKLIVTFPNAAPIDYWVLATDYSSYSLVYTCVNLNTEQRQVWSWKLSRSRSLSQQAENAIGQVVNTVEVLNDRFYEVIDNSDQGCFYFPTPDGKPVIFRGKCDENITVVTNFDAVGYMGLWYDIQSYPQVFQYGTCNTATYSLFDGGVNVFNTQVINQTLDTIDGLAVLATTDGSAKLTVSFPIAGTNATTQSPYWVLATDYSNYSLVYSCQNLEDDMRSVSSWKLSRQKTLLPDSQTAINNVINNIPVLSQDYYETKGHTDNDCFYFPEPVPGKTVIFPGKCDDTIQAVPNFNLNNFIGTWYEIEAYPKDFEPGQCVNHAYSAGTGNTLNLVSSSVTNQTLQVSTSNVQITSTDNSGRLLITLNSNGTVIQIPFWILSTDYDNYALAYSCENRPNDFRAIYSWKLSRSKQLATTNSTAITEAIANVDVLDNIYYEPIDQSDETCFYLPDLAPGEPVVIPGQCDQNISVVQNFDAASYQGLWHLIESYPTEFQNGDCNDASYTIQNDGTVLVYNTQVINETLDTITGSATLASTDGSAKLIVTFPDAAPVEYWVIDTDYASYSLVYSCVNLNSEQRRVWSWKMSRTKSLSQQAQIAINQAIDPVNVLDNRYYEVIDNSDQGCFYFPTPDGKPVIFRGKCDENITVVSNFDAVGYMGLWYDIQSYPQVFQYGTCNTATYSLFDGGVNVFNTQVINQTLDTIDGLAVLATTDGSAKLTVSFPVAGTNATTQSPYWVLATDYSNYSLVYSCQNLEDDMRSVSSWKLSRQKTLLPDSQTAINNVINNIPVLSQGYYETKGHTDNDCFYFPEPVPGKTVIFPGECNDTIQAVPNFNLNNFIGTWYEIEAYPKDFEPGQCVNHAYSAGTGNTLNLVSSSVTNQTLQVSTSNVQITSTDNSGRLLITLNSNGTVIQIPFWILSTDYDNYALAYSCENRPNDFRAIYSWKLSRSKQLATTNSTAITEAIANVDVLDNIYYEPIDQSDETCFYLPDLAPGEPVVIPGQCDQNISVVQNFDAASYQGLWHLIESYPTEFQNGDCNDASYTIQNDGTVLVYNTQVINETLDTITGSATLASTDGSAKLIVTFPDAAPVEYWVIDTDYASYSLVYSCVNLNSEQRRVWSWKMSRTKSLSQQAQIAINQAIDPVNVLDNRYYEVIDNSDQGCFYFPTPDGKPVIFRGKCDENITVVSNFDAVGYMGLWYDIQSYPQVFQDGTCATATYSLFDGGVNVFNTQVINQTLDTIDGLAVLATTDGSAKLTVSFPIAGTNATTQSPYWVLATDYSNYSLVYSCQNLEDDMRSVTSWKLSRQKTLTPDSQTNINNVINNIQVLRQDYYQTTGHTDADCFYYPEPEAGKPVVFPGSCDNTIQAVPNINLTQFSGLWHEIETYPKEQQLGQCINYDFDASSANTLSMYNTQVLDLSLYTTDGIAVLTSNDGSGKFSLNFTSANTPYTIPYWIIATDYDNYALAYSCVNYEDGTRGVWSWKLSREKQLSTDSNTAINTAMSAIDVLDQQYYEPVSQSDDACFYLPEVGPNEPVTFVGQCDQNIPVIQNFNASLFAGRWFDIESYYDDYQGECIDGSFTFNNGGFDVVFTQVVNQELDTTNSQATVSIDGSGKLTVTANGVSFDYWILNTDYDNYAFIYSCSNLDSNSRRVRSWKMSRTRELPNSVLPAINAIINATNVLDQRYYNVRNHSDDACFYYPQPVLGQAVLFRGKCDQNIAVVQNFDVAQYLGVWYDIESYPQEFQDGTCATATYSLGDQRVDVFNTQVVAQQLDTISGFAQVASTDGSAKLIVSFPIAGTNSTTQTPYWVLATDYDSYSLVYSCVEVDEEYRRVTSWKLSRQGFLTDAANTTINDVVANIPVLDQKYYQETGHTEEDCFYYPDNFGGPVILKGQCPDSSEIDVVTNFNAANFAGVWHDIEEFPSELKTGECSASEFVLINQNTYTLTMTSVSNETLSPVSGSAVVSSDGRGVISVSFGTTTMDIYILDTDYNNFTLAYSCKNIGNDTKQIYSWKLSKTREGLAEADNDRIDAIVSANVDLFEGYYEPVGQSNDVCFYYPEFQILPNVIELPGPCNETIKAKANFDPAAYLGRWFEIAKYPQPDQAGTCNRAEYSLGDGVVDVYNSQVVNLTLQTQLGSAVVTSVDGSGLLEVTFVVAGETRLANYYVLETDYDNFSLVYSCRNLENGNRQVSSWKLSRSQTLNNQNIAVINEIIGSTQGLKEEYYTSTSQSDEDCFYIPELNENEGIVFRGQCENITGVQGFNIQNYLGWWHEIERYPTDDEVGVCTSSQIQVSGNQFLVVDTEVFGVTGELVTSTLTATTDGLLKRTLSNGQVIDTWVLATDYETYSLLYSCENINDEYRRVWSAKHSKSRQLSETAEAAMAPIIENNQVLYPHFYLEVDQSDDACFYYPELSADQVILPGQCDPNIPVVQNFDAGAYTGTWYQIERYPQIHESGTCTGARYTLNEETEVVHLINWEVIDGVLDTIEGNATIISTDGSAKLSVSLPIREGEDAGIGTVSIELYVLTTDYMSYSLAYSCVNVNDYERQLGVWKLSRSRTMPAAGNNAINAYINQRQELHEPYFIQVSQNDECEEPSSGLIVKSSIIVILICSFLRLLV